MNSQQGGAKYKNRLIMCHVDRLFPYHVTSACVRIHRFFFTWLVAYLI
jgi:hypothetical protein